MTDFNLTDICIVSPSRVENVSICNIIVLKMGVYRKSFLTVCGN